MNKHVESLPKVDKRITFHYCTVICDTDVISVQKIIINVNKRVY